MLTAWQAPFSNYPLLESFHAGAKTLLAHFHHCCKGESPFQKNWTELAELKSIQLNDEQEAYMIQLIGLVREEGTCYISSLWNIVDRCAN